MSTFGDSQRYYGSYADRTSTFPGKHSGNVTTQYHWLNTPPWVEYAARSRPPTNPAAYLSRSPFYTADNLHFPIDQLGAKLFSGLNFNPAMLWARGISSPCFRHDHHVIVRFSDPPFSAGNWEIDRRHMIEVQFDQFGVASHCRSTWGRMGPWRADRFRYSVDEAYSKLQMEIITLMSRLGAQSTEPIYQGGRGFEGSLPGMNGVRQEYPADDYMNARSVMPPAGYSTQTPTLFGTYFGGRSDAWNPLLYTGWGSLQQFPGPFGSW